VAAIVAGVAALVAIRSFADNLTASIDNEAKTLLGADLELYRRQPFDDDANAIADRFGRDRVAEISLGTMAYFPRTRDSRLIRLRGVEPAYPFYGVLDTTPASAARDFHAQGGALVDRTLMLQFAANVGDTIRVGDLELPIAGVLERIPGEVPTAALVGPRVLVPLRRLQEAGLLGPGSQARYSLLFRLAAAPEDVATDVEAMRPELRALQIEVETVQYRQRVVGRALDNLYQFLYLSGFAALLLGGIGVASAMSLHARDKVAAVAALRCLGASRWLPVQAYLLQALAMAAVGSALGAACGVLAQGLLPRAVDAFLPIPVAFAVSFGAVLEGLAAGTLIAVLFAALPLLPLRRVTPLQALRLFAAPPRATLRDPWIVGLGATLAAALWGAAWLHTDEPLAALGIVGGIGAVVLTLAVTAILLRAGARGAVGHAASYPLRQGVANLYRPRNQTMIVLVTLGFGAFIIGSLLILQASLLGAVNDLAVRSEANFVLFDLQPDQRAGARELLSRHDAVVLGDTPIVPMRLRSIAGRSVADFGPDDGIPGWALRREYNSTYRNALDDGESLLAGEWTGQATLDAGPIPISLEADLAETLGVSLGDELEFDVQGVSITVTVGSTRVVDWEQVRPNFFVVFPEGVLEAAPQQIAIVTNVASTAASAALQRDLVETFRNVSVIDLGLVLSTIDAVLDQVRLAIRFMTLFVLAAGAAVLFTAVHTSRRQRQVESVLLRTLGASRRQILRIQAVEYVVLGGLAALAGLTLAAGAGWPLLHYVFDTPLRLPLPGLLATLAAIAGAATMVGLWGARATTTRPPLESLRAELETGG
jgi:putative ABC transport system permease protein